MKANKSTILSIALLLSIIVNISLFGIYSVANKENRYYAKQDLFDSIGRVALRPSKSIIIDEEMLVQAVLKKNPVKLILSLDKISLKSNAWTEYVEAAVKYPDGSYENITDITTWSIEDEAIATVFSGGIMAQNVPGVTILTAKIGELSKKIKIKVEKYVDFNDLGSEYEYDYAGYNDYHYTMFQQNHKTDFSFKYPSAWVIEELLYYPYSEEGDSDVHESSTDWGMRIMPQKPKDCEEIPIRVDFTDTRYPPTEYKLWATAIEEKFYVNGEEKGVYYKQIEENNGDSTVYGIVVYNKSSAEDTQHFAEFYVPEKLYNQYSKELWHILASLEGVHAK